MTCREPRDLVGPYFDGELVGDAYEAMEAHVRTCRVCAGALEELRTLRDGLRRVERPPTPTGLGDRIRAELAREATRPDTLSAGQPSRRAGQRFLWVAAASAACLLAIAISWATINRLDAPGKLSDDVLTAHLRSLVQDSPVQVASSESHVVKPWFAGRVDFAPAVKDLTAEGYPLIGGRLDYVGARRVAALVYKRRNHVVSVFIWAADGGGASDTPSAATSIRGHNILWWTSSGINYWTVSDLNPTELAQLGTMIRNPPRA